ncbi:hypothetical protein E4Z66_11320 [Aliishimia ponticola]|uniref:Periplasmic protein-like protein n=1 Tax=Aliishimia ponticola TaxID=2499833 RepID=A0A4S4N8X5_9RHOB|nr:hypothetical protein [Aliishimia ponticola]THH35676.1 hypothetical protein E4Z66_11320 [Aliishimia ponticola]
MSNTRSRNPVARVLMGVLVFQLGLGALLILGDMQGLRLPSFGPSAPRLTEPVQPGDQRRTFRPDRDRPVTRPARDPGTLPDRLILTQSEGTTYRLEGGIKAGDAERIIGQLRNLTPTPETVILQSPGGSVQDALTLGRHLRSAGIKTQMLAGEFCYSACPYVLAAGTERMISEDASVGVHQHYFGENSFLPAAFAVEDIQRGQGEVMQYLNDMGIDPMVMTRALSTPPDEIYVLLPEELKAFGFIPPD